MQVRGGPAWGVIKCTGDKRITCVDVLYLGIYTESGRYFRCALFYMGLLRYLKFAISSVISIESSPESLVVFFPSCANCSAELL